MRACDQAHRELDGIANGLLQVGPLPTWTRVHGRTAYWVFRGPLDMLGEAWVFFRRKVSAMDPGPPGGPPGEVFVCRPEDHPSESQPGPLTILYVPLE